MELNKDNFYETIKDNFIVLPNIIDELSEDAFRQVIESNEAKTHKNIVYIWESINEFSRFNGQSRILYIGQTSKSISKRYSQIYKYIFSKANSIKYEHAIKQFGGIRLLVCDYEAFGDSLRKAEGQMLWWYFQNHFEYPPFNYTKTKVRNDAQPRLQRYPL